MDCNIKFSLVFRTTFGPKYMWGKISRTPPRRASPPTKKGVKPPPPGRPKSIKDCNQQIKISKGVFHRAALCGGGWRSSRWVVRCLSWCLFFFTYFTQNIFICALFDPQRVMIPPAQFLTKSICPRHLEIPIFSKRVPLRHKKQDQKIFQPL